MKLFFQKIRYEILESEFNNEILEVRRMSKGNLSQKSKLFVLCFALIAALIYRYRKRYKINKRVA